MVIETLSFRLAAGVDGAEFLDADRRVQTEVVPNQPGFLRRTTARSDEREWVVIVLWGSMEEALAAETAFAADPVMTRFTELVDAGTVHRRRYTSLD